MKHLTKISIVAAAACLSGCVKDDAASKGPSAEKNNEVNSTAPPAKTAVPANTPTKNRQATPSNSQNETSAISENSQTPIAGSAAPTTASTSAAVVAPTPVIIAQVTPEIQTGQTSEGLSQLSARFSSLAAPTTSELTPQVLQQLRSQLAGFQEKVTKEIPDQNPKKSVITDSLQEAVALSEEAERADNLEMKKQLLIKAKQSIDDALLRTREIN